MSQIHKLSALSVQRTTKVGFQADGGGLYLRVRKTGAKSWVFRSYVNKKPTDISIGPVHTIDLAKAREIAADCRLAALEGRDPRTCLIRAQEGHTFKDAAIAIIDRRKVSWKSDKTAIKWRRGLMEHAKPLHDLHVSHVTIKDVERVILPLWYTQNHSAKMMRGMIEQAIDLATVLGWRSGDNPARWKGGLEYLLPNTKPKIIHHSAMPYSDAPAFYKRLSLSHYKPKYALALTILTGSRGHMVRHATWDEFDLNKRYWTIPAARMKRSAEDHIVPLTKEMIELLPDQSNGLVFPYRGKGFSENAFRSTLNAMGEPFTAHGFRSTFKDWASDCTDFPDEISELALAHKVGSSVRRAYRRSKGLEKRRELMQAWCDYINQTN